MDKSMKILIADDTAFIRKTIRIVLEKMGFTYINDANDGIQALAELKRSKYDLFISDWNMPNMNGISLLRIIRDDASLKDLPVLMVTAEAEKALVVEAIKAGINDYIVKPFTAATLEKKIENIFQHGSASPK